ncbi:hypothetical protein Tco_0877087 [Tanacetum coccineum]|uniref:Uncharacterized protein n=1 Tax=Tanacetum coccineum TaxID=301880 RepID=A0ABQ5BU44_9ASTR
MVNMDLWSMKMDSLYRYPDHILWDIITNGNTNHNDPASPRSAQRLSLLQTLRRKQYAKIFMEAIKARFGGNGSIRRCKESMKYYVPSLLNKHYAHKIMNDEDLLANSIEDAMDEMPIR